MLDRLYHDAELAQFYDLDTGWSDDLIYCSELAQSASSVLDLGCGTGKFLVTLPAKRLVGADPAAAMLEVARQKASLAPVTWVQGDARSLRLGQTFDLIVMTGHAYQTLLTDDDQRDACRTIAAHLAPGGSFIFDSREPAVEEWREWTPGASQRVISHPVLGQVRAWNDVAFDDATGVVTYWSYYGATDGRTWSAQSCIRFATRTEISARISEAGLRVDRWLGDWQGGPIGPGQPEIIAIGGLA
jgi:SAM-dependent methyltransferase